MELSRIFRKNREAKRLSQQEVADLVNISQASYANYESGRSKPRVPKALHIAEVLGIESAEILQALGVSISNENPETGDKPKSGLFYASVDDFQKIYKDVIQSERELFKERLKEKDETIKWLRAQIQKKS